MKKSFIFLVATATMLAACSQDNNAYDATGTFESTEVIVSAEQAGKLLSFTVTEGDNVSANEQVGVIDTVPLTLRAQQLGADRASIASQRPDTQKQIASTRQQIITAEKDVERYTQLVKAQAANRKQLDDAESHLLVLRSQLAAQLSQLGNSTQSLNNQMSSADIQRLQVLDQLKKCYVSSPISGTVLEKYAEQGEYVTVGKPLFKVADISVMYLRAYITSVQLADVKIGQKVKVFADYGSNTKREYDGEITWISAKSEFTPKSILTDDDRGDQVYAVKIKVKNDQKIKIGMYGEVRL